MKGIARILFQGGALLVPAQTRYDQDLVFEHVETYARRYGTVHLELERKQFLVRLVSGGEQRLCAGCARSLDTLTYALGGRELCLHCVRRGGR